MQNTVQNVETVTTSRGSSKDLRPGRDLYLRVRAQFTKQDTTLNQWSLKNKVPRGRVTAALFGTSESASARKLRERILRASGLIAGEKE